MNDSSVLPSRSARRSVAPVRRRPGPGCWTGPSVDEPQTSVASLGAAYRNRTDDLRITSASLWPTELRRQRPREGARASSIEGIGQCSCTSQVREQHPGPDVDQQALDLGRPETARGQQLVVLRGVGRPDEVGHLVVGQVGPQLAGGRAGRPRRAACCRRAGADSAASAARPRPAPWSAAWRSAATSGTTCGCRCAMAAA